MSTQRKTKFGVGDDEVVAAWLRLTAQQQLSRLTAAPRGERTCIGLRSQDKQVKCPRQLSRRKAQARLNVRLNRHRADAVRLNS
jgi:hypothetical protein